MRLRAAATLFFCILTLPQIPLCADRASLAKEGYDVVEETQVVGEFKGCLASAPLRFTNGKVFVCSTFGYDNSQYMPAVSILKNRSGAIKILINGKEYSGTFLENN